MNNRYSRFLTILFIAAIPFLIAGLFVYRNAFPGVGQISEVTMHPARYVFLTSSIIPAMGSILLALLLQITLVTMLRSDGKKSKSGLAPILTGIALIPILWGAIVATEALLRSLYFRLWDSYVLEFSPLSASSILMGVAASIIILGLSIQPAIKPKAA